MAPGVLQSAKLAARRSRTRAGIDPHLVAAITEAEIGRIEGILVRVHDRAGLPYGAALPQGLIDPDEQACIDEILRHVRERVDRH